jgi:hypothetical protein
MSRLQEFTDAMIGWRKFIVAMTAIVSAAILCGQGQVESAGFVTTVLGVLALFGGANALAKFAPNVQDGQTKN